MENIIKLLKNKGWKKRFAIIPTKIEDNPISDSNDSYTHGPHWIWLKSYFTKFEKSVNYMGGVLFETDDCNYALYLDCLVRDLKSKNISPPAWFNILITSHDYYRKYVKENNMFWL